jgi:hypothetical protein
MKLKKTITFFQMSKDRSVNSLTDLFSDPHSKAFPIVNIRNNLLLLLLLLHCTIQYPEMGITLKWNKFLRSKLTKEAFTPKKNTKFFFKFFKNSSTRSEHAVTLKLRRSRNLQQISDETVVLFYSF